MKKIFVNNPLILYFDHSDLYYMKLSLQKASRQNRLGLFSL